MPELISNGARLSMLAAQHPDRIAVVAVTEDGDERSATWRELDRMSNRAARRLLDAGATDGSIVAIGAPNSIEHFVAVFGTWKIGACPLPLRVALPSPERDQILGLASPSVVVSVWDDVREAHLPLAELGTQPSAEALPDRTAPHLRLIASGGSTGKPKLIVSASPAAGVPGRFSEVVGSGLGWAPSQTQLLATPLYHTNGFGFGYTGLFEDHTLIVMEKFSARLSLELIEKHRVDWVCLVPTMLKRIHELPDVERYDLSSLQAVAHGGAPCPPWLKRAWIDLVGPERLYEGLGSTEGIGMTTVRGDEWLQRPGTVGRPCNAEVRVLDDDGAELPAGTIGNVFMRPSGATAPSFEYLGDAKPLIRPDGFASVGDLGWLDTDGYLFIADRRTDLIITGGANVYPAEVESVLSEHPAVADIAVIGLPDDDWGHRVHAVIRPIDGSSLPDGDELREFCRARLSAYKVPKEFEYVKDLPIDDQAGKLRRSALREERMMPRSSETRDEAST